MYRISRDHARRRLLVEFIDSYADFDQMAFANELRAGALQVKAGGDHFDLLVDFTHISVMPQDVALGSKNEIDWCITNGLRRSANVMDSTLVKLQVQRVSADSRFRMFTSREDAVAWLDSAG